MYWLESHFPQSPFPPPPPPCPPPPPARKKLPPWLIDLSRIPLQCIWTIAPEQGWGGHFVTFAVFLSTLTSTWCHCLLECREGLLLWIKLIQRVHLFLIWISLKLFLKKKKITSIRYKSYSNLLRTPSYELFLTPWLPDHCVHCAPHHFHWKLVSSKKTSNACIKLFYLNYGRVHIFWKIIEVSLQCS